MVFLAILALVGGRVRKDQLSTKFVEEGRDETRSNPSQDILKIFLEVSRQAKTDHALFYCIRVE